MAEHIAGPTGGETAPPVVLRRQAQLTLRPENFGERLLNSSVVWLVLMAYWALTDILIAIFPPGGRQIPPEGWINHLGSTLAGLAAIWCMHRTGFPAAWDARIPATRRLLLPTLVGVASGFPTIVVVGRVLATLEALTGQALNVAFPGSLLVYSAASIHQELRFLLFPLPLLLWLISNVFLRGRGQMPTFWALAILSAAAEPYLQSMAMLAIAPEVIGPGVVAMVFALGFAINFVAAAFFRRYGLLAAILVRLGNYIVAHIIYGNFFA